MALRLVGVGELLKAWGSSSQQAEELAEKLATHATQARAVLERVGERLERGNWRATGWNVFEVLGRVRLEDAHSDMLAWLFKPWEAHGLGDRFLQEFVVAATRKRLPNGRVQDSITRKKLSGNTGIIDIEVRGDGWLLAVENKIDACESPGQTTRYAEHYLRQTGLDVICVFLTRKGEDAEAKLFQPLSYGKLRKLLNQMQGSADAMQLVHWFADHICSNLEMY
jgi:hypothetical protein